MNREEIIARLDIEEFYRSHLNGITGKGRQRKAKCCFHEEKTASLSIDFETGLFNCFGCGEKGSIFDFVMKAKGVDFKEALSYLAGRAGISHTATGKKSAAKPKTASRASQKAAGQQNKEQGNAHSFTLDSIKKRVLKGGYKFIRLHIYDAAAPQYVKAIHRDDKGDKKGCYYSISKPDKGLYVDTRTASPVWFNQKELETRKDDPVFIPEGEKDTETLKSLGFLSVTEGGGQDKITDGMRDLMKGRIVYIFCDNDFSGMKRLPKVISRLQNVTAQIKKITFPGRPEKFDVSNFVEEKRKQGKTDEEIKEDLQRLIDAEPVSEGPWLAIPEGWPYFIDEAGNLCKTHVRRDGSTNIITLCNFDAGIKGEIIEDDGSEKLISKYVIEGRKGNYILPPLEVLHSKYEAMSWHREWFGAQTHIHTGVAVKDSVRFAIETRSKTRTMRRVYTHTGWREIGGEKMYLTAAGAIGSEGVTVRLPKELRRYEIPQHPGNEIEAIKTTLDFLEVARHEITYPLWLMTYLSPLCSILIPQFVGNLYGERDSFKTSMAVLALCHFGNFLSKVGLPNFSDTAASIQYRAFILKDILMVVDDMHPCPNKYDSDKMQGLTQNVIRSAANRTSRGRLNSDSTPQARFYPRGMVLLTGERLPSIQSTRSRTLTVETKRNDINLERLTELQARASLLPHAMSSFIHWLRENLSWIETEQRKSIENLRGIAFREYGSKLAEHIAMLQYTAFLISNWLVNRQAMSSEQATEMYDESWRILTNLSIEHRALVEEEDPIKRFTEILQALIYQNAVRITDRHNDLACMGDKNGRPIGYFDEDWLYLIPEALWREIEVRCRETGGTFPIDKTSLFKTLKNRGLTKTDSKDRTRLTSKVRLHGETRWVLQLKRGCISISAGTVGTEEENEEKTED